MEQIFLATLSLAGGAWFLWRRKVDPLALGFGASAFYFLPGVFGSTSFPVEGGTYFAPIAPGATAIMAMVLLAVVSASVIVDRIPTIGVVSLPFDRYIPPTLLGIVAVGAAMSITSVGAYYLCADKSLMLSRIDGWYYMAAYALPLCFVSAIVGRQYLIAGAALVLLAADLYIGFRGNAAICLLATGLVSGSSLFKSFRGAVVYVGAMAAGGALLLMIPQLTWSLKYIASSACAAAVAPASAGPTSVVYTATVPEQLENLAEHLQTAAPYYQAFLQSEPFVIQAVLSEVVRADFQTGHSYLIDQALTAIPGGATLFSLASTPPATFNDLFQPALFPQVTFGMASSPWAQAFAAGGYPLAAVFGASYALVLAMLTLSFNMVSGVLKGIPAVVSGWFGFYAHRNDIATEIGILKQVIYTSMTALLIAAATWLVWRVANQGQLATSLFNWVWRRQWGPPNDVNFRLHTVTRRPEGVAEYGQAGRPEDPPQQ